MKYQITLIDPCLKLTSIPVALFDQDEEKKVRDDAVRFHIICADWLSAQEACKICLLKDLDFMCEAFTK
jgi:hypothetical protein